MICLILNTILTKSFREIKKSVGESFYQWKIGSGKWKIVNQVRSDTKVVHKTSMDREVAAVGERKQVLRMRVGFY